MKTAITFSSDSLRRWRTATGLATTLTIADAALILPSGQMVAKTYAGYPDSRVSRSVVRYLVQPCYGAPEMPDDISPEALADIAGIAFVDQAKHTVRVPAHCTPSARFTCQLLLANGYRRA